jgi:integrase
MPRNNTRSARAARNTDAVLPAAPMQNGATTTLGELAEQYLAEYHGRDRSRAAHLACWCALLGASRAFTSITDDDLFAALDRLRSQPARVYVGRDADNEPIERAKGPRSAATVNRYHATVMALFTWAIKRRRAPRGWENPACRIERAPERNQVVRFLSPEERARLFEACRRSAWPRMYSLVLLAVTTGARRGELLSLTWADVDLQRAIAHLEHTKNDHPRVLPLIPAVVEELRRFACERLEARVFPGRGSAGLFRAAAFESSWQTALKEAKIRNFRFHDLRHTCASYLAQNGASLLEIADVMGHRQLAMVKRYAHLTTDTKARLVNRVLGSIGAGAQS